MDKSNYLVSTLVFSGTYKGMKESKLKQSNILMIEFTREIIPNIQNYNLLKNSGIYFLFLDNNEIYVGQSTDIYARIRTHNQEDVKNFSKVIAFITDDNQFSKTFIDYSEWYFINKIKNKQNFYILHNDRKRDLEPKLNSHDKCEADLINENIEKFLLFANINFEQEINYKKDVFYFHNALLIFNNGKFFLLKGSIIPKPPMEKDGLGWKSSSYKKFIEKHKNSIIENENEYILKNDLEVSSSSFAGQLVKNMISCNGWTTWKNKDNKTLDEVYRS